MVNNGIFITARILSGPRKEHKEYCIRIFFFFLHTRFFYLIFQFVFLNINFCILSIQFFVLIFEFVLLNIQIQLYTSIFLFFKLS